MDMRISLSKFTLFKLSGFNAGTQVKFLHEISIKLLDLVYILHEEIYTKLLLVATGETYRSVNHRHQLAVLASDFMLLACAVISAAGFMVDEQASDGVCFSKIRYLLYNSLRLVMFLFMFMNLRS